MTVIKENADALCSQTLERLVLLISEKKASRKHYAEERVRLENEVHKVGSGYYVCVFQL